MQNIFVQYTGTNDNEAQRQRLRNRKDHAIVENIKYQYKYKSWNQWSEWKGGIWVKLVRCMDPHFLDLITVLLLRSSDPQVRRKVGFYCFRNIICFCPNFYSKFRFRYFSILIIGPKFYFIFLDYNFSLMYTVIITYNVKFLK